MEMKKQKELLIIMPAYNEEKNIEAVLCELEKPEIASIADILVMNDASSDSTNWVVKAHGHTLVTHVFNLGYGSALQLGYKYAIRRKYKYVIQMDADGQHDVCNIPQIYERLRQKDADGRYPDIVLGFKVEEIPAVMHNRQTGVSMHSGLKPVIYMFRMVFSIIGVVFRVKVLKIDAGAGKEDVFLEEQK